MEPSQSHTPDNTVKPKLTSFIPLQKIKETQPTVKMPAVCLAHLEEESAEKDEAVDSEDTDGIEGVMEEFRVCLARAIKDVQKEEKHCYHCSSLDHFICDCPLVKALRMNSHLNHKEGMVLKKEVWAPQTKVAMPMMSPKGSTQGIEQHALTPFLNPDPFQQWHGVKNVAKVKINRESCMALLDNSMQINTIMPNYM